MFRYLSLLVHIAIMLKEFKTGFKADTTTSHYLLALPTMLTKSAVCVDPIIYFGLNPQAFFTFHHKKMSYIMQFHCNFQMR